MPTPRLRGRAGMAQRKRRLHAEPLCRDCYAATPRRIRASVTPDHIQPLSKGGKHTRINTACACRRCNGTKGAEILGQLRLVA